MKKFIVIAIALFTAAAVYAQPRAIGGRLGYGLELTYQHSLGNNMVQLDFGLPGFYGLEAAATYDWIFPINSWQEQGTWNWYAGVGAGLGMYGFNDITGFVGVAGRIGVESLTGALSSDLTSTVPEPDSIPMVYSRAV